MTLLLEMLSPEFLLHHALWGSVVVGLVCPLVGVYLVLRRLVFWGVALPQVSASGIAFAFLLQGLGLNILAGGEAHERHLAIAGAVAFTVGAILVLAALSRSPHAQRAEGRLGALYAAAWAASILFVAWNPAAEAEMFGLLKGEIVSISESDFHAMLNIFAALAACMLLFHREFTFVSYDRDMAVTLGRNVLAWDLLLYLIIGLAVSLGVMTVGPLVTFGILVVPPLAALPWARGMGSLSLLSSALGGLSAFSGFYLSYTLDLPLGPVVICIACGVYVLSSAARLVAPRPA